MSSDVENCLSVEWQSLGFQEFLLYKIIQHLSEYLRYLSSISFSIALKLILDL